MNKREATSRTIDLLLMNTDIDLDLASYLADHIYADVVALAVDDERNNWIELAARDESSIQ